MCKNKRYKRKAKLLKGRCMTRPFEDSCYDCEYDNNICDDICFEKGLPIYHLDIREIERWIKYEK